MRTSVLLSPLFTLLCSAQGLPRSGPFRPGLGDNPEAVRVFSEAGRNPNATTSVKFTRTYNNTPETWTWRVNITEVAVPDRIEDLGKQSANFSQDRKLVNTQWQLEWPDDSDNFQSFIAKRNMSVQFRAMISNKYSNITDRYDDKDEGNCTVILGDQCLRSITHEASKDSMSSYSNLIGCENTFDANDGPGDSNSFKGNPRTSQNSSSGLSSLTPRDTLFYRASETYAAGNSTQIDRSKSALQILIMSFKNQGDAIGESSGPTVLCRIVDKRSQRGGDRPQGGGASGEPSVGWRQSTIGIWITVVLGALVVLCQ